MNVHDSERLSGLLEEAGYVARPRRATTADVVVFNTCAVGRTPTTSCTATSGTWRRSRQADPGMQIAVGGCLAQKDRGEIVRRAPWVDVVFGTHNVGSLPTLLERARHNARRQVEILESLEVFPSTLPAKRESAYAGWVSISVGCNNTCTFCIVPSLRGKEADRRPGDVLAEVEMLVADGVLEVTLLGQNVNSYGVEFGDRAAFAKLLRACGGDRRAGAGAVHLAAPGGLHRRRHRRDGARRRTSATSCTCRCSPGRTGCCGRCAAPTAASGTWRSWPRCARRCRTRRSPPTSSSASPARPRRTSQQTLDVVRAARFAARLHLPVLAAARHPRRRRWPTRCPRRWCTERFRRLMAV